MSNVGDQASVPVVGIDDGYADTKIYGAGGYVIPSRARLMAHGDDVHSSIAGLESRGIYLVHDKYIQVDPAIDGDDTCVDGYHGGPLNAAVIHQALLTAKYSGKTVDVAVGLPFGAYFLADGSVNQPLIDAKIANLRLPISRVDGRPLASIRDLKIYSQTVSAYIHHVVDSSGRVSLPEGPVGIVDLGGRTTDLVVVLPPRGFDFARSTSLSMGLLDVNRLLADFLRDECGVERPQSQWVQFAVRKGMFVNGSVQIDVSDKVAALKAEVSGQIVAKIKQLWGDGSGLEKVLFAGGGCDALPSVHEDWGFGDVVSAPAYANAKGMRKYMRFIDVER